MTKGIATSQSRGLQSQLKQVRASPKIQFKHDSLYGDKYQRDNTSREITYIPPNLRSLGNK